jgi:hypothetical protein
MEAIHDSEFDFLRGFVLTRSKSVSSDLTVCHCVIPAGEVLFATRARLLT